MPKTTKTALLNNEANYLPDPRAKGSNYLPFDVKIGKEKDFPDTPEGRKKMYDKLGEIRQAKNPVGKGYGLGDK